MHFFPHLTAVATKGFSRICPTFHPSTMRTINILYDQQHSLSSTIIYIINNAPTIFYIINDILYYQQCVPRINHHYHTFQTHYYTA